MPPSHVVCIQRQSSATLSLMSSIIGFDLGGTKSAAARYDAETLEAQDSKRMPTKAERGWNEVLKNMLSIIEKLRTKDTKAVGIGVPGLVRQPEGIVLNMPNIKGAKDVYLKQELEKQLKLPVFVDNDANCFSLAEALHGSGKGHKVVVGITMGTGVGGGIVIDGKIFHGSHGFSAEIGHMLLLPNHPPFETPDHRGDVEQFLSGTAMGMRCLGAKTPKDYLESDVCSFMQPKIFEEVAWLCTSLTHLLDPSIIIFGGAAGRALAPHLCEVQDQLSTWMLPGTPLPSLAIAKLPDAATLGAALLTQPAGRA